MKILYRPKMLPVECVRCGCIFHPKRKNLTTLEKSLVKDRVVCPNCRTNNPANFERKGERAYSTSYEERSERE